MNWGKTIPDLKKNFIKADEKLVEELQSILNNFKSQASHLFSIHKEKFTKVLPSREEIIRLMDYSKLCALIDSDYIKYAL